MIIAIDGPSGAGKGATAKELARRLGFLHFDTGAMYRSFAYLTLTEEGDFLKLLPKFDYHVEQEGLEQRYYIGDEDVTEEIRTPEVTKRSSEVAALPQVRAEMVKIQRAHAARGNIVCEGRDMGTVVFPDAQVKIFLTASPETRAERRHLQLRKADPSMQVTREQILANQKARDEKDSNRKASPLKIADDAIVLDNSEMTIDQVVATLVAIVKEQ